MKARKLKSTLIAISLFFAAINCKTVAQNTDYQKTGMISINMSATELIPADIIIFNININAEGKTPQDAFDLHENRESLLASLLKELDIEDEDIKFQPVRMNKRTNYNNNSQEVVTVQTNQQVSVSFLDFDIYERIQIVLIENDFDSFNGQFSSSKIEEGKTKALESAIAKAKERAEFIAKESGVTLGVIKNISYSDHQISQPRMAMEDAAMVRSQSSMMDFAQTVSVTANISINFGISE